MIAARNSSPRPTGRWGLRPLELVILGLFFLSGASALVYEVVWTRQFTYVFGGSAFAIATVLAAYMAGLALGSTVFGRAIDRRGHPLVVYGLLEAAIGVWALLLPVLLHLCDHVYAGIYRSLDPGFTALSLIRFLFSFLLLLVPTTMMGGTLPVLGKLLLADRKGLGTRAGLLYGANTLGAVLGSAVGGFVLLPAAGLHGATWVAILFNAVVAAAAIFSTSRFPYLGPSRKAAGTGSAGAGPTTPSVVRKAVLIVYAASGFAALAYEVAWTKTLSMILGTTTYAFTSMLTTFLLGLALGSFLFGKLADRRRGRPEILLALVQLGIPLLALLSIPMLGQLPQLFVDGFPKLKDSWFSLELYRIALAAGVMFLPTILMGAMFPLVTRAYVDQRETGKSLGSLYAANTIGAIFGSFLAGFVLIPWIGRQDSILAATVVNLAAAVLLLAVLQWRSVPRGWRWATATLLVLLVPAWVMGVQKWDPKVMGSGAYIYAGEMAKKPSIKETLAATHLLYYHEGAEAAISVWQDQYNLYLRTNGKVEASNHGDMVTQKLISHLPVLYHRGPVRNGLMIGLASGISVGTLLDYPFQSVKTIELIPAMKQAARYFDDYNNHVLDDPRHHLIFNDGRNHLLLTNEKYDVIVSEPSNPWIAGEGSLFTRQFFELTKKRLKPGGVVCQWVQTYQFRESDLKTILATFLDAYPYIHLWQGAPGDLILVASMDPLRLDRSRIQAALAGSPGRDLAHLEVLPLGQLLAYYVTDRGGLESYVGDWKRRVTDDNLYLEYAVPRHMFEIHEPISVLNLQAQVKSPLAILTGDEGDSTLAADLQRHRLARSVALRVEYRGILPPGAKTPREALEQALRIAPDDHLSRRFYSKIVNEAAIRQTQAGDVDSARADFHRTAVMGERGERALALNNLGTIAFNQGQLDSARFYWNACLEQEPTFTTAMYNLSQVAEREGNRREVVRLLRQVLRVESANAAALNNLAWNEALLGENLDEAERAARRAVSVDPNPNRMDTLGFVLLRRGNFKAAEKTLLQARNGDPDSMEILLHLGMARARLGRTDLARAAFRSVLDGAPGSDLARQAKEQLDKL